MNGVVMWYAGELTRYTSRGLKANPDLYFRRKTTLEAKTRKHVIPNSLELFGIETGDNVLNILSTN
jgi:hypothetical protein